MLRCFKRASAFNRAQVTVKPHAMTHAPFSQPRSLSLVRSAPSTATSSITLRRQIHSEVTKSLSADKTAKIVSQPPLPVRLALVGSSVMLATPVFTVAGMYRIWSSSRLLPDIVKKGVTVLIGGSTFTLFYQYIIPNILEYSSILLPFALSNGIACMVWQGVGEAMFGTQTLATLTFLQFQKQSAFLQQSGLFNKLIKGVVGLPVGGAIIGMLAAVTAPFLWPLATQLCWAPDLRSFLLGGDDLTWLMDSYFNVVIPVGIPVGFLSGLSMHQLLQPVVLGVEGTAWYTLSLPVLGGVSLLCVLLYRTLLPGGSAQSTKELVWVRRLDPVSGRPVSVNLVTKEVVGTHAEAEKAELKMSAIEAFHILRRFRQVLSEWLLWNSDNSRTPSDPSLIHTDLPRYHHDKDVKLKEVADVENFYKLIDILVRFKHLDLQQNAARGGAGAGGGRERIDAAREALFKEAAASLELTDVSGLYREVEKLCILRKAADARESDVSGHGENMHPEDTAAGAGNEERSKETLARTSVMQEVETKLLSHRPMPVTSAAFSFFGDNSSTSQRNFEQAVNTLCQKVSPPAVRGHRAVTLLSTDNLALLEDELAQKLNYVIQPLDSEEEQKFIADHHRENRTKALQRGLTYLSYSLIPVLGYCALYFGK